MKGLIGRKLGMTQLFDEESGQVTPVTVIEAGPCPVVQVKTEETDGYEAVQLAFDAVPERKVTKARLAHLKKADAGPHRHLVEFRGSSEAVLGEAVTVEVFEPGDKIKVSGISIGKGFAGTIKRHNFSRGPVSHGSHNVRQRGSVGSSATPSRVFKGMKMAGQMGAKRATQVGLVVHSVDPEHNLLLVKGAVPGPKNGVVEVREEKRGGSGS
jgi:large subunit ribosomal protein L3